MKIGTIIRTTVILGLAAYGAYRLGRHQVRQKAKKEGVKRKLSAVDIELAGAGDAEFQDRVREYQSLRDSHYIAGRLGTRKKKVIKSVGKHLRQLELELLMEAHQQKTGMPTAADN